MTYVAFFSNPRCDTRTIPREKEKKEKEKRNPAGMQRPGQRSSAALLNGALAATTPIVKLAPWGLSANSNQSGDGGRTRR